jgi:hypothetical protein
LPKIYKHKGKLTVSINGNHVRLKDLAKEAGISWDTVRTRRFNGMAETLEMALKPPKGMGQ